jgi:hypothetical protein
MPQSKEDIRPETGFMDFKILGDCLKNKKQNKKNLVSQRKQARKLQTVSF